MAYSYQDWLASLANAGKGPVTLPPAVRGQAYSLPIYLPGDWTAATLAGSVKDAPDTATERATFTIGTPVLEDGFTSFPVTLTGAQTAALPADADGNGVVSFLFDFLLNNERLFGGVLPLSGFVTEPA